MPRYTQPIPWLSKEQISEEADDLLARWSNFIGQKAATPIPVEAIAEKYLGLTLEYDDLKEILGIPDALGATWVEERRILINKSLTIEKEEGRLNFTCGHEIGHWILHRQYLSSQEGEPVVICRTSQAKLREEWQADYFSACLLMPGGDVHEAYVEALGPQPLSIYNAKSCFGNSAWFLDPALESAKEIANRVMIAGDFVNVSKEAMCYRLEELGLLLNHTGQTFCQFFHKKYPGNGKGPKRRTRGKGI